MAPTLSNPVFPDRFVIMDYIMAKLASLCMSNEHNREKQHVTKNLNYGTRVQTQKNIFKETKIFRRCHRFKL